MKNKFRKNKPIMTFMEMLKKGLAEWKDIDDFIDIWHESESDDELYEFLGMSLDQYKLFVERPEIKHHIEYA